MIEVKYISSDGNEYDLIGDRMRSTSGTFHEYEWTPETVTRQIGERVTGFTKDAKTYSIALSLRGKLDDRKQMADELTDSFERDIINVTPGKIYFGNWYVECFIKAKTTGVSETWNNWTELTIDVYCPHPFWIKEETRSYPKLATAAADSDYLDYDYDYDYDYYPLNTGGHIWNVGHYTTCEFKLIIYGAVSNPRVNINGHAYEVYTDLGSNDYLVIDSRDNTVIKYLSNGTKQDCYNLRAREESVFASIDAETVKVEWSGEFGFDLTLYCERSEPEWTT